MNKLSQITTRARKLWLPLTILTVFFAGWRIGLPPKEDSKAVGGSDTIWTCSMHPQIRQPNPGLCPICSMDLIPLSTGGGGGLREVVVTRKAAALMDLRVSPVVREPATVHVDLFGKIGYDERNVTTTAARVGGRLDRFFIDYTGTQVRKGDHIAQIYSPDLFVAQQDLIKARQGLARTRSGGTAAAIRTQQRLLQSSRERLRLLQLTDTQIDAIAAQDEPSDHITLFAPQDGVVTERHVIEGAYVKEGQPLFSVAGLKSVWLNLEAYERDLPWLNFAQDVAFTVEAIPGEVFHGRIAYIDPEIDPMRRVVKVRVNVPNEKQLLKPGMFARAVVDARVAADGSVIDEGLAGKWISPMHPEIISDTPGDCPICGMPLVLAEELGFIRTSDGDAHQSPLLAPASAVLRTGIRATVYVRLSANPEPQFEGREIVLGSRVGDRFIVDSGLTEGELVVTRGAFKLDSELQIRAKPSMMNRGAGLRETPAGEAEASLLAQWGPVPRALGRFGHATEAGDQASAQAAIADMEAAVKAVNADTFQLTTLQLWEEFSNRLGNALAIARAAPLSELPIAYRNVRQAVEEAGRYLGLPSEPPIQTEPGHEILIALREALTAYHTLAKSLAADDFKAASAAREHLIPSLQKLDIDAASLTEAREIGALREAFETISKALIAQVKAHGSDSVGNVYVVHCPMAFDNQGADWISPKAEIINPYFGAEMLNCGTVKANLSFDRATGSETGKSTPEAAPMHQHNH